MRQRRKATTCKADGRPRVQLVLLKLLPDSRLCVRCIQGQPVLYARHVHHRPQVLVSGPLAAALPLHPRTRAARYPLALSWRETGRWCQGPPRQAPATSLCLSELAAGQASAGVRAPVVFGAPVAPVVHSPEGRAAGGSSAGSPSPRARLLHQAGSR